MVQQLFSLLGYMDLSYFPSFLEFVSNNDIRTVYVVSNYLSADYSSDNSSSMNPDSHVQAIQFRLSTLYLLNLSDHIKSKADHIFSLFDRISIIAVRKAKDNIAVPDCIDFIYLFFSAKNIKLLKQTPKHLHNVFRLFYVFRSIWELSKAFDIRKKDGALLKQISEFKSILKVLCL